MTKFKVGDKVRLLDVMQIEDAIEWGFKNGEIYDVVEIDECERLFISNGELWFQLLDKELQYIEKVCEPTNHQRITALEKEVAELRPLKEKVEYLEKAIQQYFAVPGKPSTVEDKPKLKGITIELEKTPNQQRKEIIEKAKEFTKEIKDSEFIVNEPKRTIVLFTRFPNSTKISRRIIVKCHPDDVFNSHIGKAIALGRALGLNVSEFENAVQPTEKVVGMLIKNETGIMRLVNDERVASSDKDGIWCCAVDSSSAERGVIINDTNAQYGGDE